MNVKTLKVIPTAEEKKRLAHAHVTSCATCLPVAVRYGAELREAVACADLPDALGSKMRAQLCKEGARILDIILGVTS